MSAKFLKRIQKKSFIVLTIVSPLIMAALIFVPLWLSSIENDEQQHVAVIDPSGQYFKALKETGDLPLHAGAKSQQRDA